MSRFNRLAFALLFGGAALTAQIPNPLNLPDPLGLSKKPAPAPAPRREARPAPRRSPEEGKRHEGKHKGHDRGKHKGHRD